MCCVASLPCLDKMATGTSIPLLCVHLQVRLSLPWWRPDAKHTFHKRGRRLFSGENLDRNLLEVVRAPEPSLRKVCHRVHCKSRSLYPDQLSKCLRHRTEGLETNYSSQIMCYIWKISWYIIVIKSVIKSYHYYITLEWNGDCLVILGTCTIPI